MHIRWLHYFLKLSIVLVGFGALNITSYAQNNDNDEVEVYLDFRHRGVISTVIISYYKNDEFYLPVSELFSLFNIDHQINGLVVEGQFGLDQTPYRIDLQGNRIRFGDKTIQLTADDYLVKELDSYLRADIFYEAFALDFTINFNNLTLDLQTEKELPVIEQAIRRQRRQVADRNRNIDQEQYGLKYGRERPFLDGGFLDYNLSSSLGSNNVYNVNTNLGLQILGGDLQGNIFGSYSQNFNNIATNNLRWRHMFRDKHWLTKLTIGQTTTDGFARNNYTGIRLSNEPIEPRRLFNEFEIQGSTIPESEVELFLNNALIDFQQAGELGNYRFLTPITYGTSQLDLKIYGPTGQIIERSQRIQIPFTFQPKGVFNYTINAGKLDNPVFGETTQDLTAQGNGAYGLTDWLTAKAGVEYYQGFHDTMPTFTTSISSRILSNYILSLEAASEAYYRGTLNVIYPNSASINFDYTEFSSSSNIYNPSNDDKRIIASAFYPFNFWGLPLNIRASTFSRIRETSSTTSFRTDLNSRIGKMNVRIGYSDRFTGKIDLLDPTSTAYLESSATYNISRNRNLPAYIRGVFLRAQMRYQPTTNQVESAEALISRNVFQKGRFQISFGRNFIQDYSNVRFSLVVDFDKVRSNTTFNNIRGNSNLSQNIRGSLGYDTNYNNFIFTSRDQVGRSGAAIQMYVDNNDNSTYDEGDDIVQGNSAIRIQRSGATSQLINGILYYTQMQPYFYYNMEMNKGAIDNPMLVPEFDKFGFISDPNRFKKVEIPFYMSGVIEGIVERETQSGNRSGVAGLRVFIKDLESGTQKELRTFSDGSFYDYEVKPGQYELVVDSTQLELLNVISVPEKLSFEVEAKAQGDFIEGLNFTLIPVDKSNSETETSSLNNNVGSASSENNSVSRISIEYDISVESIDGNKCQFELQYASFNNQGNAFDFKQNLDDDSAQLIYSTNDRTYALRSQPVNNLYDVADKAHLAAENSTLVWNCDPSSTITQQNSPAQNDIQHYLQFAVLSNPQRADSFSNELNQDFNLNTVVVFDEPSNLYKIKEGPFNSDDDASAKRNELLNTTTIEDIYISRELSTGSESSFSYSETNSEFRYLHYLGDFNSERSATLYAMRIDEAFGLTTKILSDGEYFYLVSDEEYENWDDFLAGFTQIENSAEFSTPLVLLKQVQE